MISWFSNDILSFVCYVIIGFGILAFLVHRSHLSRWTRFILGLFSVLYGTLGFLSGSQLLHSIKDIIQVMPWNEIETSKLVYAATSIEWIGLILQFSFAAVGAGLIVNAITVEKPLSPPIANLPLNTDDATHSNMK